MKYLLKYEPWLLPIVVAACSAMLLQNYFLPQLQIVLGILVAPFIFKVQQPSTPSNRYFYIALVFFVLYYFLYMKLMLFLGLGCFLFYSIERRFGKTGVLPFIFLISISPALHYLVATFTFTLRLALSHYAAELLNGMGCNVQCEGNYFVMPDGFIFNVDKACLGLNMFNTGLAFTCLLVGLGQKQRNLPLLHLGGVFVSACLLLIVTNFLRILMIVFFRSLPGTTSHELIGIFSLLIYMALPVYLLVNFLLKRFGKEPGVSSYHNIVRRPGFILPLIAFAFAFFSFKSVEQHAKTIVRDVKLEQLQLPGFTKAKKEDGVMEYRRDSLLIYIKPAVRSFESDHPPVLCWQGSGFEVEQVAEVVIDQTQVLMATLKKGNTTQYTAWWYDNGKLKTIDQWAWRLHKGEPFRIVNLTSRNKEYLVQACKEFIGKRLF